MDRFELTRQLFGEKITVLVLRFEQDIHLSIYGGARPHIGAVTVAEQEEFTTTQLPGHKEAVICEQWARAFLRHGFGPVVVEAGIHYDGLDRSGIQAVLDCTDQLMVECLKLLGCAQD